MSALNALMVAIELATRKRDEARQLLRQRQQSLAAAQEQMQQLQSYQAEMQQRWGGPRGGPKLKPEVMYHHHQFMSVCSTPLSCKPKCCATKSCACRRPNKP